MARIVNPDTNTPSLSSGTDTNTTSLSSVDLSAPKLGPIGQLAALEAYQGTALTTQSNFTNHQLWCPDTGATHHITNNRSSFYSYQESDNLLPVVTGGGGVKPEGFGDVVIRAKVGDGEHRAVTLHSVLYIPQFPINLLSGVKLLLSGGTIDLQGIRDKSGNLIAKCNVDKNGLFLDLDSSPHCYLTAYPAALQRGKPTLKLWHRRLGHVSWDTSKENSEDSHWS